MLICRSLIRLVGSSPALCVVSTLVQKPMSAMEEQKLAVGIINLLSANVIRGRFENGIKSPYELYKYSKRWIVVQFGRKQIFTDEMQITKDNVIKVLQDALIVHEQNRTAIKFLLDYERGIQPIDDRIKEIRPEINIKVKDNMAAEITEFKLGYEWGSPIRYVQRANKGIRENNKDADNVGIAMLNEMMEEENKPSADQELARFIEICGVGYRLIKANVGKNMYQKTCKMVVVYSKKGIHAYPVKDW